YMGRGENVLGLRRVSQPSGLSLQYRAWQGSGSRSMSQASLFSAPVGVQDGCRPAPRASMTVGASILTCPGGSERHTQVCVVYTLVRRRTFLSRVEPTAALRCT